MKCLELVGNQLLLPRIALECDLEAREFVCQNRGMFEYDPCRDVLIMKPWAVSTGLRAIKNRIA